jgi:predicted small secreted protein
MMRLRIALLLAGAMLLSACDTGPYLGVGLGFGPGGVSVSPSVSGKVGDVTLGASL